MGDDEMREIGYACINMTLSDEGVCANRTLRMKTLEEKGYEYLSELIVSNLQSLKKILNWNAESGYRFYRMSSEMFPFMSHPVWGYDIENLPRCEEISTLLMELGNFARLTNQRLTYHPGPFNVLASPNPKVVSKTIVELNAHSHIFDLMGYTPSVENKINIHVGGAYGDKASALNRFCSNFQHLDENTKLRLTVENDDRGNLYSLQDLYLGVYRVIGIPLVFDYHHHIFNTGGLTEEEALKLAMTTWPENIVPVIHYSESKTLEQGLTKITPAHSDYIKGPINTYNQQVDVMVEAKAKELAVQQYLSASSASEQMPSAHSASEHTLSAHSA